MNIKNNNEDKTIKKGKKKDHSGQDKKPASGKTAASKKKSARSEKSTKKKQSAKSEPVSQQSQLNVELIQKLNEFILLSIQQFANEKSEKKTEEYEKFIQDHIHIMTPLFFTAGEEFMNIVFERTTPSGEIQKKFTENWDALKNLSAKLFQFVTLQVNLIAQKNPPVDQEQWKQFIIENLPLMNEYFFSLGGRIFNHLLDLSLTDQTLKKEFKKAWNKTKETILKMKGDSTLN